MLPFLNPPPSPLHLLFVYVPVNTGIFIVMSMYTLLYHLLIGWAQLAEIIFSYKEFSTFCVNGNKVPRADKRPKSLTPISLSLSWRASIRFCNFSNELIALAARFSSLVRSPRGEIAPRGETAPLGVVAGETPVLVCPLLLRNINY